MEFPNLEDYLTVIKKSTLLKVVGKVIQVVGLVVEAEVQGVSIGELCKIYVTKNKYIFKKE